MATRSTPTPAADADHVRRQLEQVLGSATFHQVDRLKRFINFIVLEAIAGRSDELKEYVIGVQVFDKEPSFDPRTDPIVRVQARRLRARLLRYYQAEGAADDLVIDLPKGGYAPVFTRRATRATAKRSISAALVNHNTIAVLPFSDHSQSGDLAYFCRGVRQEVLHQLAAVNGLRVIAWDPTDQQPDVEAGVVAGILNAALIVTGSSRRSGDRIRVTAQLIDGATGCYLWSEAIDSRNADVLAAQEAVGAAVVNKVRSALPESGRPFRRRTENLAARNLYLQGRYHLNQRTEESLHKAADFFHRAIVEDAEYALAHSGLADAYGLLGHYGVLGPAEVWTRTASSAATAVMLDETSSEAHTSLAHVKSTQDWDWAGADREYLVAIALDARYPTAHHWYAMSCLAPMGRLEEALDQMLIAQSLDPVSSIIARDLAVIHMYRRDFEAALDQCDHTIELNPHFSPAYLTLGLVQEQRRDFDESAAAFQRAIQLAPLSPRLHAALGCTWALSGQKHAAMKALKKLQVIAKERYVSPFEFASFHFAIGQTDRGFTWLSKACDDRCFELIALKVDPRFDALRRDKRFAAIAKKLRID